MNNGALSKEDRTRYDIALSRWRADLLDLTASKLDSVDLADAATKARERAQYFREAADIVEAQAYGIAEHGSKGPEAKKVKLAYVTDWQALKQRRDAIGVYNHAEVSNNFVEPSPQDLGVI
jgi:hypothetical protein